MILRATSYNIQLPNPERGNTEELKLNISNSFAMDGTIYSYARPSGEVEQTFSWKNVDVNKAVEFEKFIKLLNNEEVFIDFLNEKWRGRIMTPSLDIIHESKIGCAFSIRYVGARYA